MQHWFLKGRLGMCIGRMRKYDDGVRETRMVEECRER